MSSTGPAELARQLRTIVRRLWRTPLFTLTSVVTLALGIGATTAIFSVVNGVLLEPLPYEEPDRLVGVWFEAPALGFDQLNQSAATFLTLRDEGTTYESVGLWDDDSVAVTGVGDPEELAAMRVSWDLLPTLGVTASQGRVFEAEDDEHGSPSTVLLSHEYWQRRFGARADVVGESLEIDGRARDIIGVLPAGFRVLDRRAELYLPFQFDLADVVMGQFNYQGVGRLADGATLEQANADLDRLIPVAAERFPGGVSLSMLEEAGFAANVYPLHRDVVGNVGQVLWVLLGTVGFVLLIACANVANLFLVRAEARHREMALRSAMGAGRGRLAGHFLLESVLLGLVGGALGLALAFAGLRLLVAIGPSSLPRLSEIGVDSTVLVFTGAISVLAGLLFGFVPVARLRVATLAGSLKEGGRGGGAGRERHRMRSALVVAQVALALVLLVGAGLMMRSFQAMRSVSPGFQNPEEVLTFRLSIPHAEVEGGAEVALLYESIARQIEALPGVVSVALASSVAMDGRDSNDAVWVEGFPVEPGQLPPIRRFKFVSGNYPETLENPVLAGRSIDWSDIERRSPVVMVTENFAREYWGDAASALGKRVRTVSGEDMEGVGAGAIRWREIVGVVADVHDDGVDREAPEILYWPMVMEEFWGDELMVERSMRYAVRSDRRSPEDLLPEVRRIVWAANPKLPLASVRTLEQIYERRMARTSFTLVMLGIASLVALLLGTIGIYGVISYLVSQRTREIGVRMALGAKRRDVSGMMVRYGTALAGAGIVAGVLGALALSRLMGALLFGVEATDPLTYLAVAAALALVTLLASLVAARRAAGIDPVVALRSE